MHKTLPLIPIFLIFSLNLAFSDDSVCSYFYPKLSELPNIRLTETNDGFRSISDGIWARGCEIIFKSHNSIVSGERVYNTFQSIINTPNWAINDNLSADGPGSSSVTIETDKNRCTILWSQHAWIDEKAEEHKQSSDIEMIIQCSSK